MAAMLSGSSVGSNELKGVLNLSSIVLQPDKIENAVKNPDSSWTYHVRWKNLWLHEALCLSFQSLIDEYWDEQGNHDVNSNDFTNETIPEEKVVHNDFDRQQDNTRLPTDATSTNTIINLEPLASSASFSTYVKNELNRNQETIHDDSVEASHLSNQKSSGPIQTTNESIFMSQKVIQTSQDTVSQNTKVNEENQPADDNSTVRLKFADSNKIGLKQIVLEVPISQPITEDFTVEASRQLYQALSMESMSVSQLSTVSITPGSSTSKDKLAARKSKYSPQTCDICQKVLSSRNALREHRIVVHLKNGNFPCTVCGKRFSHTRALKIHSVIHSNERNHICDLCGSAHKRDRDLNLHKREMHSNTQNYRCDVCFKCFKSKAELRYHCFDDHETLVTKCIVCKQRLNTPHSIYIHCLKHSQTKEFKCDQCEKEFTSKGALATHKDRHDPIRKPFKSCPVCAKDFFSRSHYYEHVQSHDRDTNELKKYRCEPCGTSFLHLSSLRRHMLRHRPGGDLEVPKENPYLHMDENDLPPLCCRLCRRLYTSKSGYYDHIKRCRDGVLATEICEFCGRKYSARKTLNRHLRRFHAHEIMQDGSQVPTEIEEDDLDADAAVQIIALAPALEGQTHNSSVVDEPMQDEAVSLQTLSNQVIELATDIDETLTTQCEVQTEEYTVENMVEIQVAQQQDSTIDVQEDCVS